MSIIKEDGTGVPGANAYQELSEAVAYLASMGYTALGAAGAAGEGLLVRGTASVDQSVARHASAYSLPLVDDQGLFYPRAYQSTTISASDPRGLWCVERQTAGVRAVEGVPDEIIRAAALKAEAIAYRAASKLLSAPANLQEVEMAKGVRVRLRGSGAPTTPELDELNQSVAHYLGRLLTAFQAA